MKHGFAILAIIIFSTFWLFGMNDLSRNICNIDKTGVSYKISQKSTDDIVEIVDDDAELKLKTSAAVQKAFRFLADSQSKHGYWLCDVGYKLNDSYQITKTRGKHPGITSIACLAFMANGHFPGRGHYGDVVRKGLNFVLGTIKDGDLDPKNPGYASFDGTRMYSHAFATLFLAEILGMANFSAQIEKLIHEKLVLAVKLIVKSQNELGAWRYQPNATDADTSIAVCQLQALRAARNVGLKIPKKTIARVKEFIARSYENRNGSFYYQYNEQERFGSRASWTLTAAGICAMQQAGQYQSFHRKDDLISLEKSIKYLEDGLYNHDRLSRTNYYSYNSPTYRSFFGNVPRYDYFYGHYYAAQAIYQFSIKKKSLWKDWFKRVRKDFLTLQRSNGSWTDQVGVNYATAMAALILQIHHEYLPIFQK
ncbi:MAG: terpene cyclase/mutase family protein [Planctomycetes bacterium]|nr:terpene cyclase/mutase family protein [Planctomycetota bacterium]